MADQAERLRLMAERVKKEIRSTAEFERRRLAAGPGIPSCRVVAITSGKGGVGKTNLAVNLGLALSAQGMRVILIDTDIGLANADVILGLSAKADLSQVVDGSRPITDVMIEGPLGMGLIPGGSGLDGLVRMDPERLARFAAEMATLEGLADLLLLDTGAGISENVLGFVAAADEALLVTTPEPTAITDAYAVVKQIASCRPLPRLRLVVNRASNPVEARQVAGKLAIAAREFLSVVVDDLGYILEDPAVPRAVRNQKPFYLAYPNSPATRCLSRLAENWGRQGGREPARGIDVVLRDAIRAIGRIRGEQGR